MKELFEKIYIKSEADLPNIEDVYFVHLKSDNEIAEWCFYLEGDHREWLKYIDWYLQPLEHPELIVPDWKDIDNKSKQYHNIKGGYHPDFGNGFKAAISEIKKLNER